MKLSTHRIIEAKSYGEHIHLLMRNHIPYEFIQENLKVYDGESGHVRGGSEYDIYTYIKPSINKKCILCISMLRYEDSLDEEAFLFELEDNESYDEKAIIKAIRLYHRESSLF